MWEEQCELWHNSNFFFFFVELYLERECFIILFSSWSKEKPCHCSSSVHLWLLFYRQEALHFWLSLFNEAAKRNDPSKGFHQLNMHAEAPTRGRSAPLIHKWTQYFILICSVQSVRHRQVPKPRHICKAGASANGPDPRERGRPFKGESRLVILSICNFKWSTEYSHKEWK